MSTCNRRLQAAGLLFDAGLHFEVHEVLEPHWAAAQGDARETLQGLIQIAVGYQHLANGNHAGARSLLVEGSGRLHERSARWCRSRSVRARGRGRGRAVGRPASRSPFRPSHDSRTR